jgi:branched-chain amino acid aminotransferase
LLSLQRHWRATHDVGVPQAGGGTVQQTFDERNRDLIVSVGGRLTHRDEAAVSPFDSAVQGGDAVWEGLRLYYGRIFRLDEHLARLRRSARALAFAKIPPDEEIVAEIRRTLAANQMTHDVHIRLTLTRGVKITSGMDPRLNQSGPTLIVLPEHKPPVYDAAGITLITSSVRRHSADSLDPKVHHNNLLTSILAKIEANAAGADDAVMLDSRGFVAETNATNLFFVIGGQLSTPSAAACPEGITRQAVIELAETSGFGCRVGDFSLSQLYGADELFVTGTMGGLTPVLSLDGRQIGTGRPGPVFERLSKLFAELTATTGTVVV